MDTELKKNLILIQNKGALVNGEPTSSSYDNTTDSLEQISDEIAKIPKSDAAVSWNATALADIQTQAEDALIVDNLDHLEKTAVANNADMTAEVSDGTVLSNILSKTSDTSTYVVGTDSLEAISDKIGTPAAASVSADIVVIDGFHDVPAADVVTNAQMRDVVGNKTDANESNFGAATTKSIVAGLKGIARIINRGSGNIITNGKSLIDVLGLDGGTGGPLKSQTWDLIQTILDLKRDETIVKLTDAWNDEDGINANVWVATGSGTATAARDTSEGGKLKVRLDTVAGAQTARLRSYDRFSYAPSTMTGAHIIRKTVLEFEAKFTNLANVDETTFFMGLTPATGDDRTTNNVVGFFFSGAPASGTLTAITDNGGAETVTTVVGTGITLTNWHKYMIEIYDNAATATIKFTVTNGTTTNTATYTTNIPTQNGFIQFYNVDDNAGGTFAILDIGMARMYSYDTLRY